MPLIQWTPQLSYLRNPHSQCPPMLSVRHLGCHPDSRRLQILVQKLNSFASPVYSCTGSECGCLWFKEFIVSYNNEASQILVPPCRCRNHIHDSKTSLMVSTWEGITAFVTLCSTATLFFSTSAILSPSLSEAA